MAPTKVVGLIRPLRRPITHATLACRSQLVPVTRVTRTSSVGTLPAQLHGNARSAESTVSLAERRSYGAPMTSGTVAWDEDFNQRELESPTAVDVRGRIGALDGVARTLVTIYRESAHLSVGGSARDGLIVYCSVDHESFWQLLGDTDSEGYAAVVAGGQVGQYPARHIITREAAVRAAVEFLEHGDRPLHMQWEQV